MHKDVHQLFREMVKDPISGWLWEGRVLKAPHGRLVGLPFHFKQPKGYVRKPRRPIKHTEHPGTDIFFMKSTIWGQ